MKRQVVKVLSRTVNVLVVLFISFCLASTGWAEEKPAISTSEYVGDWSGKTSQGFPISLRVEDVKGRTAVVSISYKIKMQGEGWSATTSINTGFPQGVEIVGGKFHNSGGIGLSIELRGEFISNSLLKGSLKASQDHPQALGTAVGEATYTATKNKTNSLPLP